MNKDPRDPNQIRLEDGDDKADARFRDELEAAHRMKGVDQSDIDALAREVETFAGVITVDLVSLTFERLMAGRLRYNHDDSYWYVCRRGNWERDRKDLVFEAIRDMVRIMSDGQHARVLKEVRHPKFARAVETFCRSAKGFAIVDEEFNPDPFLLGTPSGVVNLRSGAIRPPKPEDLINQQTLVTPATFAHCPRFKAFLLEANGGDQYVVDMLQVWFGYCLTADTREHALIFLQGPGGNGKSVLVNVVSRLMGSYAATAPMETFIQAQGLKHTTDLAGLAKARLVIASEVEKGRSWDEQRVKAVTGGDPVAARFMRQDFFTFVPRFKLTIVGNHTPKLNNVDPATKRRFNIVPFTVEPAVKDPLLEQTLVEQEGPEILRWMIDGCAEWLAQGRLVMPDKVRATSDKYFRNQDVLGQWLEDQCHIGPEEWETVEMLYTSYTGFMEKHIGEPALSKKAWGDLMEEKGFERYRTNKERGHRGVSKKNFRNEYNERQ
jgi:putative DNA primase/helicase